MASRGKRESRRTDAASLEVQRGVEQLARSVTEIEISLRRAEQKIEADAIDRVRRLRTDAREQLAVLRAYEREAIRILTRLSTAANDSWGDLEMAAERALKDAHKIANSMMRCFRRVMSA